MSSSNSYFHKLSKKNFFYKKLFFYYNIYIRNFKFLFNSSQLNEEKYILKIFRNSYKGNFVDLGCFHPTRDNNTFRFYKKNWTGINVDLNPITIELFNFFRSKDININCAISDKKTQKKMYFVDNLSPLNTLDQNHLKFLKKNFLFKNKDFKEKKIKTENIKNILKKYKFNKVDFLNIDLEGLEYEVIKSINFKKYKINLICIEILDHNKQSKDKSKKILKILKKNNFRHLKKIGVNSIFKNISF